MKKSYKLSIDGIKQLQNDLNNYKKDIENKCEILVKRLLEEGLNISNAKINESPLGKYITVKANVSQINDKCEGVLLYKGAVKQSEGYAPFNILLAVEFGAGIYHNPMPNPKSEEFGFGVGTFPEQIHAFEDTWFYFDEKEQKWLPTHGVKATMPMYNATLEIATSIEKIAREVFR